jgi:hypothetical protein
MLLAVVETGGIKQMKRGQKFDCSNIHDEGFRSRGLSHTGSRFLLRKMLAHMTHIIIE